MSIDKLIITISGTIGIILTYWFFFGKKEDGVEATGTIDVVVDGGYKPAQIIVLKGKTTTLNFLRRDANSCLEEVVLPEFKIRKNLPLNEKVSIKITPQKIGTFPFSCGMGMFHGKIIVKD